MDFSNPFQANVSLPYPLKTREKPFAFPTFSGGIEMEHGLQRR